MRLLIDANLSPRVAAGLRSAGLDARHVADAGLVTAADEAILEHAAANDLVIISADSDFGELLAASPGATSPSFWLADPVSLGSHRPETARVADAGRRKLN